MSTKGPFAPSEPIGAYILITGAVVGTFFGILTLSNATMGVGILACCCELAILGRISQASKQHSDVMRAMKERQTQIH